MVYRLSRVSLWSVTRIAFIIFGSVGLAFGAFYGLILAVVGNIVTLALGGSGFEDLGMMSGLAGVFVTVFFGMLSGVVGSLVSAIFAWLYNIVAHLIGGIRFEMDPEEVLPTFDESTEPTPEVPDETPVAPVLDQPPQVTVLAAQSSPITNDQS